MLLAKKYAHQTKQGLINYVDFHKDMENIMETQSNHDERFVEEKHQLVNESATKVCFSKFKFS